MFDMIKVPFLKQADTFASVNLEQLGRLHNWLSQQAEGATMQEIKRAIPNWPSVDREMEMFVSHHLIERRKRVYHCLVPEISEQKFTMLNTLSSQLCETIQKNVTFELPAIKEFPWLMPFTLSEVKRRTFSRIVALPHSVITPIFFSSQQCGKFLYIDVNEKQKEPIGLVSYFAGSKKDVASQQLLKEIGDVNPSYFLEMSGKQLKLIADGQQPRLSHANIFLKTLKELEYVTEKDGDYQLATPLTKIEQSDLYKAQNIISQIIETALSDVKIDNTVEKEILTALVINSLLKSQQGNKYVSLVVKSKTISN